jgi:hypothetical protein
MAALRAETEALAAVYEEKERKRQEDRDRDLIEMANKRRAVEQVHIAVLCIK